MLFIILHHNIDHILYHPIYHLIISYNSISYYIIIIIIDQISCHIVSCHIVLYTIMFSCLGGQLPTAKGSQGIHEVCVPRLFHLRGEGKTPTPSLDSFLLYSSPAFWSSLFSRNALLSLWCFPSNSPSVFLLILSFLVFFFFIFSVFPLQLIYLSKIFQEI